MKDEKAGYKMYKKLGYKAQAKDEKRHYNLFKKKYKQMEKETCSCVSQNKRKKK